MCRVCHLTLPPSPRRVALHVNPQVGAVSQALINYQLTKTFTSVQPVELQAAQSTSQSPEPTKVETGLKRRVNILR